MNTQALVWLDDAALARIASQGASDPSIWARTYDATCPSEYYRGYATLLAQIGDGFRSNTDVAALRGQVDAFDLALKALPADQRRDGAMLALVNVAGYAQAGTAAQIAATLGAEVVCIARCFLRNRALGL